MLAAWCSSFQTKTLLLAAALALSGAVAPASAETVLRTMLSSDIRGLMPGTSPDVATGAVMQNIYEGLVAWRADGTVAPMLAEAIDVSADGRTYAFTLRRGVRFHNGAPLTAKEVVWTWERFLDPKQGWSCRANVDGSRLIKIEKVEALDDARVAFHLAQPSGVFLSMLARSDCDSAGIAHPDSLDGEGRWAKAIGTGPFRLTEWRRREFIELARFADYASRSEPADGLAGAKRAEVDRIRITVIPDPATAQIAIRSGNLDVWPEVDPASAIELRSLPDVKVADAPTAGVNMVLMQARDPALADPRIRRAIAMALDTDAMRDAIYSGFGQRGTSLVPSTSINFGPVEQQGFPHNVAKAKQLLKEAGYAGQTLVIATNSQFAVMKDTGILVQSMLQSVGINAQVEVLEFATMLDRYFKGRFQLQIFNATSYLDPVFSLDRYIGGPDATPEKVWRSEEANALLAKLFSLPDATARQPVFDALHQLFLQDAPIAVWTNRSNITAVRSGIRGFQPWAGGKPRYWNVSLVP